MSVLLTGASGFLGRSILKRLSVRDKVITIGRADSNDIQISLTDTISQGEPSLKDIDKVIHAAGLAHILPKSKDEEKAFFDVNLEGTKNLCKWIDSWSNKPKIFVFISTVAVYGAESGLEIDEEQPLRGDTPYALSKIQAENFITEWGVKNNIEILILRLPLIIGSDAPGNLGKMVNGIRKGRYLSIGGGKAKKSMVMAEDVAELVSSEISSYGVFNLTDAYNPTFSELEAVIASQLNKNKPKNIPLWCAKFIGLLGNRLKFLPINSKGVKKISSDLTFSDTKARHYLGWDPSKVLESWKI